MTVDYKLFQEIDIRVGTIIEVNDFLKARNPAYQLKIDFGLIGILQSSAQLTKRYEKTRLVGTQVIAVVNLGSKRIAGFKSECLVLGVVEGDDVILLEPESFVPNGQQVL